MHYTADERIVNAKIAALHDTWRSTVEANDGNISLYVPDGIAGHYLAQKTKILFVGQECLGLAGDEYIDMIALAYETGYVGELSINSHPFHRLILKLSWAINNGLPDWDSLPKPSELAAQFGTADGVSFAFMNLSKYSNESGSSDADWQMIDAFLLASKHPERNLFNEQIALIDPDLIITMNLQGLLRELGELEVLDTSHPNVSQYRLLTGNKSIPLFDTFHFSARSKSPEHDYYLPLRKMLLGL